MKMAETWKEVMANILQSEINWEINTLTKEKIIIVKVIFNID